MQVRLGALDRAGLAQYVTITTDAVIVDSATVRDGAGILDNARVELANKARQRSTRSGGISTR